jgi:hemerythrin-like domain-containing protein
LEFARHVDRHFSFEEQEGFMHQVLRRRPTLSERVEELRREHEALRNDFQDLLALAERSRDDAMRIQLLGTQLDATLLRLREHEGAENEVMQEAFLQDLGSSD